MIAVEGNINPLRTCAIVLGQSATSKGVMFVLYSFPKTRTLNNHPVFLGILAQRLEDAIENAKRLAPTWQIQVWDDETLNERGQWAKLDLFPFGKYKNRTIQEIFEIDPQYIWWACNNCIFTSKSLQEVMNQYKELAKDLVIAKNKENANPPVPVDTILEGSELTVYKTESVADNITQYKFKDANGNYFVAKTTVTEIKSTDKFKVTGHYETMGLKKKKIRRIK